MLDVPFMLQLQLNYSRSKVCDERMPTEYDAQEDNYP